MLSEETRCGCKGCARARKEGRSDFAKLVLELALKELNEDG